MSFIPSGISWRTRPDLNSGKKILDALSGASPRPLKIGRLESVFKFSVEQSPFPELILKKRNRFAAFRREFENYLEAEKRGVPVPRVFAVGKRRRFGLTLNGYLLMECLDQTQPLAEVWQLLSGGGNAAIPRRFLLELARFTALLFQKKVFHGDFSANNILVRRPDFTPQFYLIDLDPCGFPAAASTEEEQTSLAQLALHLIQLAPRAEESVLRFLIETLRQKGGTPQEQRRAFLEVKEKILRRYWDCDLPKGDKSLPADPAKWSKDQRAQRLIRRGVPVRLDYARPEGYLSADAFIPKDKRTRIAFLRETAQALRAAHFHRIRPKKITLNRLILRLDPSLGTQIYFLDPEEFEEQKEITFENRVEDLKNCWKASKGGILRWRKTDRLRFLKFYLGPWCTRRSELRRFAKAAGESK